MLANFVHPQKVAPLSRFRIQLWELGGASWKNETGVQANTYSFVGSAHRRPTEIRTKTILSRDGSAILRLVFPLMPSLLEVSKLDD